MVNQRIQDHMLFAFEEQTGFKLLDSSSVFLIISPDENPFRMAKFLGIEYVHINFL